MSGEHVHAIHAICAAMKHLVGIHTSRHVLTVAQTTESARQGLNLHHVMCWKSGSYVLSPTESTTPMCTRATHTHVHARTPARPQALHSTAHMAFITQAHLCYIEDGLSSACWRTVLREKAHAEVHPHTPVCGRHDQVLV